jgi:hypothetical protein
MIKKADFIFMSIVILLALGWWGGYNLFFRAPGGSAVVMVDGREYGRFDLSSEQTITISGADGGYNSLALSDHRASVIDADCPDRLCVSQRSIGMRGETIVCLPHRLVISIEDSIEEGGEGALDGYTY